MSFRGKNPPNLATATCSTASDSSEFEEPPLNTLLLPIIKTRERSQLLPAYDKVLVSSTKGKGAKGKVAMSNLKQLQHDLEKMLSISAMRSRILRDEIDFMSSDEDDVEMISSSDEPPEKHMRLEEQSIPSNIENQFRSLTFNSVKKPSASFRASFEPYCDSGKKDDVADINLAIPGCSTDDPGTSRTPPRKRGVKRRLNFDTSPFDENVETHRIVDGIPKCKSDTWPMLSNQTKKDEILKALNTGAGKVRGFAKRSLSNVSQLRVVINREAQQEKLKKELDKVDQQIVDIHCKIVAEKQKHAAPPGEEGCCPTEACSRDALTTLEEQANQLLRTQRTLIKEIRDLTLPDTPI